MPFWLKEGDIIPTIISYLEWDLGRTINSNIYICIVRTSAGPSNTKNKLIYMVYGSGRL